MSFSFEDWEITDETNDGTALPIKIMTKPNNKLISDKGYIREQDTMWIKLAQETNKLILWSVILC